MAVGVGEWVGVSAVSEPSASVKLSVALQEISHILEVLLEQAAGERISFVLILNADNVSQYVSNCKREDGVKLIEHLLERWRKGRADIPAHYNPDLKGGQG